MLECSKPTVWDGDEIGHGNGHEGHGVLSPPCGMVTPVIDLADPKPEQF